MRLVLLCVLVLCAGSAPAAVLKMPAIGCRAQTDATALDGMRAKGNADGFDRLSQGKISTGDCASLARGTIVTVEGKAAPLICVRLEGGLDCLWVPDRTIALENPEPVEHKTTGNRTVHF